MVPQVISSPSLTKAALGASVKGAAGGVSWHVPRQRGSPGSRDRAVGGVKPQVLT